LRPVEVSLDVAFGELEPGRAAVDDAAVRGPWLSPNEVTQYSRPKVLPDMETLAKNALRV